MTKREICERLMEIRDYSRLARGGGLAIQTLDDMLEQVAADLKHLLLDLAAPEEEKPKAEEKHPGIIVDHSGKNPPRCLRCGLDAEVVSYIGRGEEWACCPKCGCAYRIKREKDEK